MLPVSIPYRALRGFVGLIAVLARQNLSKDAELLVPRREITRCPSLPLVRYTPADRIWLAALPRLLPCRRWSQVFAVTPATISAWHHKLFSRRWDYTARRRRAGRIDSCAQRWSGAWWPRRMGPTPRGSWEERSWLSQRSTASGW
jgi:hypothetical protein